MSIETADGEYEQAKRAAFERGCATQVNIRMIERRCGLRAGQLANYRANHYSRNKKLFNGSASDTMQPRTESR